MNNIALKRMIGEDREWGWMIVGVKSSSFVNSLVFCEASMMVEMFLLHCL